MLSVFLLLESKDTYLKEKAKMFYRLSDIDSVHLSDPVTQVMLCLCTHCEIV